MNEDFKKEVEALIKKELDRQDINLVENMLKKVAQKILRILKGKGLIVKERLENIAKKILEILKENEPINVKVRQEIKDLFKKVTKTILKILSENKSVDKKVQQEVKTLLKKVAEEILKILQENKSVNTKVRQEVKDLLQKVTERIFKTLQENKPVDAQVRQEVKDMLKTDRNSVVKILEGRSSPKYTRNELKVKFANKKMPTGQNFSQFIDSVLNLADDSFEKSIQYGLVLFPLGSSKTALSLKKDIIATPTWQFNLEPFQSEQNTLSPPNTSLIIKNVESNSDFYITGEGNVGIKRSNPKNALEVNGNATISGQLEARNLLLQETLDINGDLAVSGNLIVGADTSVGEQAKFKIQNNDKKTLLILSQDGKLSIGRDKPRYTLDVDGDAAISGNLIIGSDNCLQGQVKLSIQNDKKKTLLHLGQNGKLGIGRDRPRCTLDVDGSAAISGNLIIGSNDYLQDQVKLSIQNDKKKTLLYLEQDGKLGIGSDKPRCALDVGGSAAISGNLIIGPDNCLQDQVKLSIQNDKKKTLLYLEREGKLGIGRADPQYTLDVKGDVGASSLIGRYNPLVTVKQNGESIQIQRNGKVPADGKWYTIASNLTGFNLFQITACLSIPGLEAGMFTTVAVLGPMQGKYKHAFSDFICISNSIVHPDEVIEVQIILVEENLQLQIRYYDTLPKSTLLSYYILKRTP